jgi:hypothetical protein
MSFHSLARFHFFLWRFFFFLLAASKRSSSFYFPSPVPVTNIQTLNWLNNLSPPVPIFLIISYNHVLQLLK